MTVRAYLVNLGVRSCRDELVTQRRGYVLRFRPELPNERNDGGAVFVCRAPWQLSRARPDNLSHMPAPTKPIMTIEQAYEAAYRFVWQYHQRQVSLEPLALMLVSMEPTTDYARTNDPASWSDWEQCVAETLSGEPVPRFPSVSTVEDSGQQSHAKD